jgi:hypothetical protein
MNPVNVEKAIAIVRRAKNFDMTNYQIKINPIGGAKTTEEAMHACGNRACFAGYVAISPEWKADGGEVNSWSGTPMILDQNDERVSGSTAIAYWLGISDGLSDSLVHGNTSADHPLSTAEGRYSLFYEKMFRDVEQQDVINKLELILKGELH